LRKDGKAKGERREGGESAKGGAEFAAFATIDSEKAATSFSPSFPLSSEEQSRSRVRISLPINRGGFLRERVIPRAFRTRTEAYVRAARHTANNEFHVAT